MQVQSIVQQLLEVVCPGMHRVRRASLVASVLGALRGRRLMRNPVEREHSFWLNVNTCSGSS